MNNNEILNTISNDTERIEPSSRLNPESIENTLKGVKRKSNKGVVGSCVTLGVACICTGAIVLSQVSKPAVTSYDNIYAIVEDIKKENEVSLLDKFGYYIEDGFVSKDIYYESALGAVTNNKGSFDTVTSGDVAQGAGTPESSSDHSNTNVQVDGVDEADVVKTDGKYIYSVCDDEIFITDANNGNPELITSVELEYKVNDIYIGTNRLVAVANIYENDNEEYSYYTGLNIDGSTTLIIYDTTDITKPEKISDLTQSGHCISTRKIGDVVYLTTSYSIYDYDKIKKDKPETYCPVYSANGNEKCVPAECIVTCEEVDSIDYLTVSSVDLNNPNDFADVCSVLGGGADIYASLNNIYVTSYCEIDSQTATQIFRLSIDGTEIEQNGSLYVDGTILNQFSMDEHNGYFRVVTEFTPTYISDGSASVNLSDTTTTLYVYDENLKLVGQTDNVAEGEHVKSVRFDGDIAYFVTFRQTDPLFTVDLSDPENPKILSELKIPGFSEYLHVMSEDLLLGFGREADPLTGRTDGLKLSMFDISDKSDVTELTTLVFENDYAYSEAEHNHKAIYIDKANKIIGIPYRISTNIGDALEYVVFKYDDAANKFVQLEKIKVFEYDFMSYDPSDSNYNTYSRGLRIGEYFYIVTDTEIISYNYSDFQTTSSLLFK